MDQSGRRLPYQRVSQRHRSMPTGRSCHPRQTESISSMETVTVVGVIAVAVFVEYLLLVRVIDYPIWGCPGPRNRQSGAPTLGLRMLYCLVAPVSKPASAKSHGSSFENAHFAKFRKRFNILHRSTFLTMLHFSNVIHLYRPFEVQDFNIRLAGGKTMG